MGGGVFCHPLDGMPLKLRQARNMEQMESCYGVLLWSAARGKAVRSGPSQWEKADQAKEKKRELPLIVACRRKIVIGKITVLAVGDSDIPPPVL